MKEYYKLDEMEQLIECPKKEATEKHIRETSISGKMLWSVYRKETPEEKKFSHIFTKEI